jgi:dihydroorotate dehydrogenase
MTHWRNSTAAPVLVQVYTGFIYEGPTLIRDICDALLARQEAY